MSDNVNVGLMRYSNDSSSNADGGMVMHPIERIEDARGPIKAAIADFRPAAGRPLSETLYEAHQYFVGDSVVWGRTSDQFRMSTQRHAQCPRRLRGGQLHRQWRQVHQRR